MKVSTFGEYKLVKKILKRVLLHQKTFTVAPGDDAFIAKYCGDKCLVCTTDLLIDRVHFSSAWLEILANNSPPINLFRALGYKALAVNLSDFAAMGGANPLYCLVGLGLPKNIRVRDVDNLYFGLEDLAKKYNISIVGGDTNSSQTLIVAITLLGTIKKCEIVKRSGARIGDSIYVTGSLGDSAAGMSVLQSCPAKKITQEELYFIKRHLYPIVRLKEGKKISKFATSMIDCSDGLVQSVRQLCEASNTSAEIYIDKIPISKQLKSFSSRILHDPSGWDRRYTCERDSLITHNSLLNFVLYGGEDYELIFTAHPSTNSCLPNSSFATPIGKITAGGIHRKIKFLYNGKEFKIQEEKIFNHFK
ncbi:MAG: thiamine-phosphate kinase [Elusimicrobiota bacterium]|nr:thiamine-phosphate kinase [Elusimicrobiota bacterium]